MKGIFLRYGEGIQLLGANRPARAVVILVPLLALPAPAWPADGIVDVTDAGPATVCFTTGNRSAPGADCAELVTAVIDAAGRSLRVQAYNFTEPRIVSAIIAAHERGVDVTVILDKTSPGQRGAGADEVAAADVPVFIDARPKIAHNKVMIVDDRVVITGSFNFSINAWRYNAENLLVLRSAPLAAAYGVNFARRLAVSRPYEP